MTEGDNLAKQNAWHEFLTECRKDSGLASRTLLLLGDRHCGKTALLSRMQGEEPDDGTDACFALGFTYLDAYDKETGDLFARTDAWVLEGDETQRSLLSLALGERKSASELCVLIVLDYSRPWLLVESLQRWLRVLEELVEHLENVDEARMALRHRYERSGAASSTSAADSNVSAAAAAASLSDAAGGAGVVAPLDSETLKRSLGASIVVACAKCDMFDALAAEQDLSESQFEFIEQSLRHLCLQYGAALIYTSAKSGSNCDLLHSYVQHLLYGVGRAQDFGAQVHDKATIFVPSGVDSMNKIRVGGSQFEEASFDEVIRAPPSSSSAPSAAADKGGSVAAKESAKRDGKSGATALPYDEFLRKHYEALSKLDASAVSSSKSKSGSSSKSGTDVLQSLAKIQKGSSPSTQQKSRSPTPSTASSPSSVSGDAKTEKSSSKSASKSKSSASNSLATACATAASAAAAATGDKSKGSSSPSSAAAAAAAATGSTEDHEVLSNFFNSLMKKDRRK